MRKLLYTLLFSLSVTAIFAAAFTPGNIVVVRIGTGTGALTTAATPVFLDEYSSTGILVQSVALPTANSGANNAFTLSGTSTSEGALSLSPNGQYLSLAGYDTTVGVTSVNGNAAVNRVIAVLDGTAAINTATGIKAGGAYSANSFRAAVTVDGTYFYTAGSGTGGTYYVPSGSITAAPVKISNAPTNTRVVNIFNGQLYTSSSSTSYYTVSAVGTGLPTTTGQTTTVLPGLPNVTGQSYYGFQLLDVNSTVAGVDVLYVTDDASTSSGGIYKFSLVSGSWVANGKIAKAGMRGISLLASCTGIGGYASDEDSVYRFVDSTGYNQTIKGSLTKIAGAGTNKVFRGIAFTPGTSASGGGVVASAGSITPVKCAGEANGSATITTTGGTPAYTYAWTGGGAATATRSNLAAGTYIVTVTDQIGCSDTAKVVVTQPNALTVTIADTGITCSNYNNGKLGATVTGGTPAYTSTWNDNTTNLYRTNLIPGTYTLNVVDSKGCTASASKTLTNPAALQVTVAKTDITCGSSNNGTATATTTGGTRPFTYVWSGSASTDSFATGLVANSYTVNVTDAKGCSAAGSATIAQSASLAVTGVTTDVACNGASTGAIDVSVLGGTAPYGYSWTNAASTAQDRTNLIAGTYGVTVTDNGGCTGTQTFTLTQPATAVAVNGTATNAGCHGSATGAIDITATGGTPTYTYNWGSSTSEDLTAITAGNYTITVTDSKGCTATKAFTITQGDSITITAVVTNVKCFGGATGGINVTVTGGTPTYTYSWGATTTEDRTNIAQGAYSITVTDSKSCTKVASFTVIQPASLVANAGTAVSIPTGTSTTLGAAQTATGGTAPYSYAWTPASNLDDAADPRPVASNVTANTTYSVVVTDDNGCTATSSVLVEVTPLGLSEATEGLGMKVLYLNDGDVAFAVEAANAANLTLNIYNVNGQVVFTQILEAKASQRVSIPAINKLASGMYVARFDANGKAVAKSFVINK